MAKKPTEATKHIEPEADDQNEETAVAVAEAPRPKAKATAHPPMPPNRLTPSQARAEAAKDPDYVTPQGVVRTGLWLRETGTRPPLRFQRQSHLNIKVLGQKPLH